MDVAELGTPGPRSPTHGPAADHGGGATTVIGDPAAIRTVIVVFKTHLDLGFTDFAAAVERLYFNDFFPRAVALARECPFRWTTGSYILSRWLDSLSGAALREAEAAVAAGHLAWHALPFTFHSELLSPGLLDAGLAISRRLDQRFGRMTIAAKMTDVPGHTRGIVPRLARAGVRFLHLGVNPFSQPVQVPRLFRWRAPTGDDVVVQYDPEDYGLVTALPGQTVALCLDHTGDNIGPPTLAAIVETYARLGRDFPSAKVVAGTLDDYARLLDTATLPVVTREMGDTWIHGVGSAPAKVAAYRELLRRREHEPPDEARDRRLLCVAEHTWGMGRVRLDDYTHNTPAQLRELRTTDRCRVVEASWREQAAYVQAADDAGAAPQAGRVDAGRRPSLPPHACRMGGKHLERGDTRLELDPTTGAAVSFVHAGREWLGDGRRFGLFRYEVFSQARCDAFVRRYGRLNPQTAAWGPISFARPNFDPADTIRDECWFPHVKWREHHGDAVIAWGEMDDRAVRQFGCPREVALEWQILDLGTTTLTLRTFGRQASRLPDAMWCSFVPQAREMKLEKLGDWIDPLDVLPGGNRHLHAVGEGVRWAEGLHLNTLDAPLVAVGAPTLCPAHDNPPDPDGGVHVNLWNNWWNTNFPYWSEEDLVARFELRAEAVP